MKCACLAFILLHQNSLIADSVFLQRRRRRTEPSVGSSMPTVPTVCQLKGQKAQERMKVVNRGYQLLRGVRRGPTDSPPLPGRPRLPRRWKWSRFGGLDAKRNGCKNICIKFNQFNAIESMLYDPNNFSPSIAFGLAFLPLPRRAARHSFAPAVTYRRQHTCSKHTRFTLIGQTATAERTIN